MLGLVQALGWVGGLVYRDSGRKISLWLGRAEEIFPVLRNLTDTRVLLEVGHNALFLAMTAAPHH